MNYFRMKQSSKDKVRTENVDLGENLTGVHSQEIQDKNQTQYVQIGTGLMEASERAEFLNESSNVERNEDSTIGINYEIL